MTRYDPFRGRLDIRFANDTFAELTARLNLDRLDIDRTSLKRYHITAVIDSSDVRLHGDLKTDVLLDHPPTEKEAILLLDPPAQESLAHSLGEECFYDLYGIEIKEM